MSVQPEKRCRTEKQQQTSLPLLEVVTDGEGFSHPVMKEEKDEQTHTHTDVHILSEQSCAHMERNRGIVLGGLREIQLIKKHDSCL